MMRRLALLLLLMGGCATQPAGSLPAKLTLRSLSPEQRLAYVREASVWAPIDTAKLDLRGGPSGGRFASGSELSCQFVMPDETPSGYTPKFLCRTPDGKTWKIKYGTENLEVYGEVIGSRLLWALGFFSDRIDPVLVKCHGCPEDPWQAMHDAGDGGGLPPTSTVREFEPAIIESYHGTLMESQAEEGIHWKELLGETSSDPARAQVQSVRREALALLAAFLQHADSKPSQQSLSCAPGGMVQGASGESCSSPEIYIGDIGAILGDGWKYKRMSTTKVDYALWKATPVWADPKACVATLHGRPNASLGDVRVTEPARAFLAERLSLLSREQLRDLFAVARVELLQEKTQPDSGVTRTVSDDDWADLFLERSRQIIDHRCPASVG